jgi:hypothetical protein
MLGHGSKLRQKMEQAIVALLSHRSVDEAARAVRISANTLLRWLKEPEFEAAYREARAVAFQQAIARLQEASGAAATTVLRIMLDQIAPATTRLRAAEVVLEMAAKAMGTETIEARVAELEREAIARKRPRKRTAIVTVSSTEAMPQPATTPARIAPPLSRVEVVKQEPE